MNTDQLAALRLHSKLTVDGIGPGLCFGISTDRSKILVGYARRDYTLEGWMKLTPYNDKSVFRLVPIEQISFLDSAKPTKSIALLIDPSSIAQVQPDSIWRSRRGKNERFSIMGPVGDDGIVKLLGIDTPGYRRDTHIGSFVKLYFLDGSNES